MTDSSLCRKKRKITYTASPKGVKIAENALKRLGFESKSNFAKSQLLSRSTVTKFFQCNPIQLDSFKRICEALQLNWAEIAGIIEEEKFEKLGTKNYGSPETNDGVEKMHRQVTVIDKQSQEIKAVIVLEGDINSVNNDLSVSLELVLRRYVGDTIKITGIQEGSIRLIVEGSQEDIKQLLSLFKLGELSKVRGFPVEDVQVVSEILDNKSNELNIKWLLVQEIISQPIKGRNLSGADLSDVDLSGTNLNNANLSNADLSNADLSNANLKNANLSFADFSDTYLSNANLELAELSSINLAHADLSNTYMSGANLNRANLNRANLNCAYLIYADLSNANLEDTNLKGAYLSSANLSGANLSGANLSGANLCDAKIDENTKIDGKWRLVWEIVNQEASDRNLSGVDLSGAYLSGADLSGADLSGAYLQGTDLHHANLRDAKISGNTQIDGKWRLVWKIVNQKAINQNLSGADLSGADLSGADLSGSNLSGADLSGADLSGADLSGVDLSGADLSGADLSGADLSGTYLNGAVVMDAWFRKSLGLTEDIKFDLEHRGAIFDDCPPIPIHA